MCAQLQHHTDPALSTVDTKERYRQTVVFCWKMYVTNPKFKIYTIQ